MNKPEILPPETDSANGEDAVVALQSSTPGRTTDVLVHSGLLIVALGVVILACTLRVENNTLVVIPGINQPLPELCTFRRMFNMDCPGCGLTRCFISLGHGKVMNAMRFNPAGILLFGIVLFQIPYRTTQLWRIHATGIPLRLPDYYLWILMGFSILLVIQWIVRTVIGF